MRFLLAVVRVPILAAPQAPGTPSTGALVRGVLLERDAQAASGQFSVRAADSQVFRYLFDPKTYVERDNAMIDVARLEPGDRVEVVSDQAPGAALRYALTVHVLPSAQPVRSAVAARSQRTPGTSADSPIVAGNLFFSGVVARVSVGRMLLRTREDAGQTILLRQDTRYVEDGRVVDAAALKPNMRVYVQAGKSLYDDIEAYQIVWGRILQPK